MLRIEFGLCVLALIIAFIHPQLGSRWFENVERRFAALARRRALSVILAGLLALALRAALLPIEPTPEPIVHDEFGYLLAADTYAHGRLTNPTHPMWMHFESLSIIQRPTYQCFAQPAQGMILAFGTVIFGHPFWGVWLSSGVMSAAICWMLQGWLPARWALLGGLLAVLRYGTFSYWGNSYWGGAMAAIGGALVIGALPRIKRSRRVRDALAMGVGLSILANSRPYEGFVLSLPVAMALFAWMFGRKGSSWRISLTRVVLPISTLLAAVGIGMGYYSWRVTGSVFKMAYQVERETYSSIPFMLWQPEKQREHVYPYAAMKQLYTDAEPRLYRVARTPIGFIFVEMRKALRFWRFYLGPVLTFPLLMLSVSLPPAFSCSSMTMRTRLLFAIMTASLIGVAAETFFDPHYAAPVAGLVLAFVLLAMRHLQRWQHSGRPTGLFLTRAILVIAATMFTFRAAASAAHLNLRREEAASWDERMAPSFGRAKIERELDRVTGPVLVVVRYTPQHNPFEEWVYNRAEIDNAHVVWAREMDGPENDKLLAYFYGRRAFLLQADAKPPALSPYNSTQQTTPQQSSASNAMRHHSTTNQ